MEDQYGQLHDIEVTVHGWNVLLLIDAVTTMPLAVTVGPIQAHEVLWARALVTHARMNVAGASRLAKVVFDQGFWDGTTLWWLDQQGIRFVVPANTHMAVTADTRAQAAAGGGLTMDLRVHTVRQGQGQTTWAARQTTEVVGVTVLTTDDQPGTPDHAPPANRRDFQAHPIKVVVVCPWHG